MINKGYFSYKNKYNKEYGYEKEQSHNLKQISKDTGVSMKGLQQIYNKGIGAYKTNPSSVRPSVKSKEQWAMARVYSSVMGGKASKIDANELKMTKGGGVGNLKFKIKSQEDRTEISIKDIGSVTLVETYPKYEFQEDLSEKEFDKLGLDEDDIIGKIEHIEINDEYKGKGYAKLLMKKAIEVADKKGLMPLYLNASPMGFKGLNIKDLTSFYESFGFKVFFEQGNNNLMILDKKLAKGGGVKNSVTQKEYLEYLIDVSLEMDIANQNLIDYLKLKGVLNIGLLPTEIKNDLKYKELFTKFNVAKGKASSKVNVKLSASADRMVRMDALQEYKKILANEIEKQYKMTKGGGVGNIENFSLARFEDFDEEDERENEENEKGAILLEAIEYGRKTLDQNLLPKLLANTELSNIIFIYLSKYKEFNLYKLGWRIQFGLSKKWVGLCSVKEYEKMGVGKESKNRNLYLSSQFHKYDKNWKTNIKETVHHEMAHAVVRELFYFSDDTFGVWSRFSEIDPLNEQTEGHGKIWEMICNTILEGGGCSRYIEGLDLEVQFKDWKYECFNCGTKKFGNRSNFATKCVTCGKSVLIQKNKY